ncbi:MAG TPA: hypothetical protein VE987_20820, partial [Polyangiaceae bacterium]|nr:hypothetical protein [Polyangiaceae bacterium]
DDWGYPCCATQGLPYSGVVYSDTSAVPDCSGVATENASFIIGHTPFGLDFEPGVWPSAPIDGHPGATWNGRAFVTLHGDYGTWSGARVVALALDPATGLPLPASELPSSGTPADDMIDFATGWDDGAQDHGRPGAVVFAPDGRLFIGDDQLGAVVWIAPVDLTRP